MSEKGMDNENTAYSNTEQRSEEGGGLSARRRNMMKALGATSAAVGLAGCGTLLGGSEDESQNPAGEGEVPSEPIQLGAQLLLSGAGAAVGVPGRYGVETAVRNINEAGGVAGRQIETEIVDEATGVVENYRQFVDDGKDVTVGTTSSGNYLSLMPEVEQQGVINMAHNGNVTSAYYEEVTDPTYNFRAGNVTAAQVVSAVRETIERFGDVDTIAGINPNYAAGQQMMENYATLMESQTGAEVVYSGFPDLGTEDFSPHITEVNNAEPDVTFSILWGGDASTFLNQALANNMFQNTQIVVPFAMDQLLLFGSSFSDEDLDRIDGVMSGRSCYWGYPTQNPPREEWLQSIADEYDLYPGYSFSEAYMNVTAWATAAQAAVDTLGGWPSQEQLAGFLEGHSYYTPFQYGSIRPDHQGVSAEFWGVPTSSDDHPVPVLDELNVHGAASINPPPGLPPSEWFSNWS